MILDRLRTLIDRLNQTQENPASQAHITRRALLMLTAQTSPTSGLDELSGDSERALLHHLDRVTDPPAELGEARARNATAASN